jgi:hypothetical protein
MAFTGVLNLQLRFVRIEPREDRRRLDRCVRLRFRHRYLSRPFGTRLQELARYSGTGVHDRSRAAERPHSRPRFFGVGCDVLSLGPACLAGGLRDPPLGQFKTPPDLRCCPTTGVHIQLVASPATNCTWRIPPGFSAPETIGLAFSEVEGGATRSATRTDLPRGVPRET